MKVIIFAGGQGTRLWPLSRKNSPKQFEKYLKGKSTFQKMIDRVLPVVGYENIYVSTNKKYAPILKEQVPDLPEKNFILEPERRDLAPAVGLAFLTLKNEGYSGSIAILWADSVMKYPDRFRSALKEADELITDSPNQFIFFGENPTFANHNLGWITVGREVTKKTTNEVFEFKSWVYRPELEACKKLYASGDSLWNTGYFVTTVDFVLELYQKFMPDMLESLKLAITSPENLEKIYPQLEQISFDDAIVMKTSPNDAKVLKVNLGWDDPGTLYALKKLLANKSDENAIRGKVHLLDTKDSLIFNYEEDKLVTTVGLDGFIIVNMEDTLLIVHKDQVPDVKKLVAELKDNNLSDYV